MRLFAALDPPPEAIADLDAVVRRKGSLRWVPAEQWHITLAFYGEVDQSIAADLIVRLERAAGHSDAPTLQLKGAGCFPRQPNAAKVLWAGLDGDLEPLTMLADRCVAAGRRSGIEMERRRFKPHLTLARARSATDMSGRLATLWDYAGPRWSAGTLRLVHSTLGATVRHDTLAEWPLST